MLHAIRQSVALALLLSSSAARAAGVPTPSEYLQMPIGADRVVADYRQIRAYFAELDRLSPRLQVETLGETTMGEPLIMAVISSESNMARLPQLQEVAARVADPRGLSAADLDSLVEDGRATVLVTCNIHSTEIGASQMAMEWAHALVTAEDEATRRRLDAVVLLLVPSLNPDGQIMVTEWYRKYLGTRYEGGRMPWLYHKYVGHDDNRDWFMLTQKESQALSHAVYHRWFPQVWLDEHQMGSTGPRIFMPPYAEPVDPDIHPLVWRETNVIGANMALRLEQQDKSGVIYGYSFDAYWPGGTKNTAWFKNITGLLTEVASVRFATPIYVEPSELSGGRKGLVEYQPQTNFPNPWPGGWWRLRDIIDYELIVSDAYLESCADHREDLLRDMAARARAAVDRATSGEAIRIPRDQRDWPTALRLASLLDEHNVDVRTDASGDLWVPLAQPYGVFVREMLGTQRFPEVKLVPGPDIVRPYDVAAWSLPLMMGVTVESGSIPPETQRWTPTKEDHEAPSSATALPPGVESTRALNAALRSGGRVVMGRETVRIGNVDYPAGTAFLDRAASVAAAKALVAGVELAPVAALPEGLSALRPPRVGIYKPWMASMDEGWTRFLLDQYGFEPVTLDNATIRKGKLHARCDAIVLPDVEKEIIETGKWKRDEGEMKYFTALPPEYAGGLGDEGAKALRDFVESGGTLVALASACEYVLDRFNLPVVNTLARTKPDDFACPGSLLRTHVRPGHPVTFGLPGEVALFVDASMAFRTSPPGSELERWVLATYPDDRRDVLLSGWMRGEERLTRRAAAVALTTGKGRLVLLGFRPQHRAQTAATFPFLFNALYWSTMR